MKKRTKIGLTVFVLILCMASYRFGIYASMNALDSYSSDSQAMFAFNHIGNYTKIKNCLENGRHNSTSILVENFLITERELLADHLKRGISPKMTEYIKLRTREGLDTHKAYKSNRGNSWKIPSCK